MKKASAILACLFIFGSCKQETTLNDIIRRGEAKETNPIIPEQIMMGRGLHTGKNIIFTTDASCSICKYEYLQLARTLCLCEDEYDTLYVFVKNAIDSLDLEYPLYKANVSIPKRKTYIYEDNTTDSISSFLANYDFAVTHNGQLVFICNIQALNYAEKKGLYLPK